MPASKGNKKRKIIDSEVSDPSSESDNEEMDVGQSSDDEGGSVDAGEVVVSPPDENDFALASGVDVDLILPSPKSTGKYVNRQRCLVLCTRGVTQRHRHLLEDIRTLIPHMKKDSKLDEKQNIGSAVNEIASVKSCNSAIFLECRKRQDCYMWVGLTPNGPSAKFHISNVHTLDELKMTGNCMKGSRPLLSFDASFKNSDLPHLGLIKELLTEIFGTPRGHPKSKPFIDRVMSFYVADGRIWVRNYQIVEEEAQNAREAREKKLDLGLDTSLVEIGPRFVLNPMRIFAGSFSGQTLYTNPDFVSPNEIRSLEQKGKGAQYQARKTQQKDSKERKSTIKKSKLVDPLADVFK